MGNKESGPGERKDKKYFSKKIDGLIDEAEANGQNELAAILCALLASIELGASATTELAKLCADFSKQKFDELSGGADIGDTSKPDGLD